MPDGSAYAPPFCAEERRDDEYEGREQDEGLQTVGPHDGAYAALTRIEPDEQQDDDGREPEGNADSIEDEPLEHQTDQIEACGSTQQFGQEEEGGTRAIGRQSETTVQIGVDGREAQPVIDGQQHEGHQHIAWDEAETHLQIGHIGGLNHKVTPLSEAPNMPKATAHQGERRPPE